ncbi:two-component system NtrC family response regulator [Rhodopirellula rubra]|uniref:Two-component system NtrC family response regulator n=2 Tax=Aporhodopirellula rubra TaxID=980271 RepID=A0A7W5DZQ5_9BACT|nr:two-component system NtrC family response regulator [Aporhodopirellula rubra]
MTDKRKTSAKDAAKAKAAASSMHILFADDEKPLQELMRKELPRMGYRVTVCPDGITAVEAIKRERIDCLLVDLNMPGFSGIEVIAQAREIRPEIEAIIMTANPSTETAIDAIKYGTFDYLTKPTRLADIATLLGRVSERREGKRLLAALMHRLKRAEGHSDLIGGHESMEAVRKLIGRVAPTESTVLVRGETGCGKELVARAIHDQSLRADKPFVAVNCGALPENLIESELFGHTKGAFTGADVTRVGLFEVASGGTLFLDEIGELPLAVQAKLLRVLETGDIRRLGDNESLHVDVRIVCATHRDLETMVSEQTFREDLMFRINTFELRVPPLRERIDDLVPLANHLLRRHRSDGVDDRLFTEDAIAELKSHQWPGNVRELANVIEHASVLCDALPVGVEHLPSHFSRRKLRDDLIGNAPMSLKELEQIAIDRSMKRHDGNKKAVAEELGVSLKTLYNRLSLTSESEAA